MRKQKNESYNRLEAVVVGNDHYNTLWLVRSLGMTNYKVTTVIKSDRKNTFVEKSKYCSNSFVVKDFAEMINVLLSMRFSCRVPVIASSDEAAAFLDENFDCLSAQYVLHDCRNKGGEIICWMNKSRMLDLASKSGLTIPKTFSFKTTVGLSDENVCYPCLIKPQMSAKASKDNFRICLNSAELQKVFQSISEECDNVVVQELIKPDYEYLIYGVRKPNGEIVIPGGLRKVHTCDSSRNMGMMTYGYYSAEFPKQLGGINKLEDFLQNLDYHGIFSMEFMITKNNAYFLEINLRNDGTLYCTTQAGINIPAIWASAVYGSHECLPQKQLKRKKTYCMNEINYIKYTLMRQSVCNSVREILRTKAFSLIKWDDLHPVLSKFMSKRGDFKMFVKLHRGG